MWTNTSLPPLIPNDEADAVVDIEPHFTVPVSPTGVPEDGPPDVAFRKLARRGATRGVVWASTLRTSIRLALPVRNQRAYVEPVTQRHVADRALSAQGGKRHSRHISA